MPETIILTEEEGTLSARRGRRRGRRLSARPRRRGTLLDIRLPRRIKSPRSVRRAFGRRTVRRIRPVYYQTNGIHRSPMARYPIQSMGGEFMGLDKGVPAGIMRKAWRGAKSRGEAMRKAWRMYRGGMRDDGDLEARRGRRRGHRSLLDGLEARRGRVRRVRGYSPVRSYRGLRSLDATAGILPAGILPRGINLMDMVGAGTGLISVLYLPKVLPIPATFKVGIPKVLVSLGIAVGGSFIISKVLRKPDLAKPFFMGAIAGTVASLLDQFVLGGAIGLADFGGIYSPEMITRRGSAISELNAIYGRGESMGDESEEEYDEVV
jgi:hypothetical protein